MPILDPEDVTELPNVISTAFKDKATLPAVRLAGLFGIHVKTLHNIIREGNLRSRNKGLGTSRPRKVFALEDAQAIWNYLSR